jgi:hypothetical protein
MKKRIFNLTQWKRQRQLFLWGSLLLLLLWAAPTLAQGGVYELSHGTLSNGGGSHSGGDYQLTSVIGQPEAGPVLSGGKYTLVGGFLPVPVGGRQGGASVIYLPIILSEK